jgi:hypothetical protein
VTDHQVVFEVYKYRSKSSWCYNFCLRTATTLNYCTISFARSASFNIVLGRGSQCFGSAYVLGEEVRGMRAKHPSKCTCGSLRDGARRAGLCSRAHCPRREASGRLRAGAKGTWWWPGHSVALSLIQDKPPGICPYPWPPAHHVAACKTVRHTPYTAMHPQRVWPRTPNA